MRSSACGSLHSHVGGGGGGGGGGEERPFHSNTKKLRLFSQTGDIDSYLGLLEAEGGARNRHSRYLSLLQCCAHHGAAPLQLVRKLLSEHSLLPFSKADRYAFATLFKAIASIRDLAAGKAMHSIADSAGFGTDLVVSTSILSMYGKCGDLAQAEDVFASSHRNRDVVCWNAMLTAYVDNLRADKALLLYRQMQEEVGMYPPTHQTIIVALQACGLLASDDPKDMDMLLEIGEGLHSSARAHGFLPHVFVHTTLVRMYGKCGAIEKAENVFRGQSERQLSLWNAMISSYVEQDCEGNALQTFRLMQMEGVAPDQRTYVAAIQACVSLAASREGSSNLVSLAIGRALHDDANHRDFSSDAFVGTTLISLYGKHGAIPEAEEVFERLSEAGGGDASVLWNAMLSAYIDQAHREKVLALYRRMEREEVALDVTSLICVLQACSEVGSLETCYDIHFAVVAMEHDNDVFLRSVLIHGYGGSGSMADAHLVYDAMPNVDSVSMNACITGYAGEGSYGESVQMFAECCYVGIELDGITYASVMSACNHAGQVSIGIGYFVSMADDHDICPDSMHYVCIADLLGRAGDFRRVEHLVQRMSGKVDLSLCLFLLGSCRMHGNVELAREMFEHVVCLEPTQATAYVSMSNVYAEAQSM